jgi:hypothetical protein
MRRPGQKTGGELVFGGTTEAYKMGTFFTFRAAKRSFGHNPSKAVFADKNDEAAEVANRGLKDHFATVGKIMSNRQEAHNKRRIGGAICNGRCKADRP